MAYLTFVLQVTLLTLAIAQDSPLVLITAGLTYKPCTSSDDCRTSRKCISQAGRSDCKEISAACVCIPEEFIPCETSSTCPRGEICARLPHTPYICIAPTSKAEGVQIPVPDSTFFRRCPLPTQEPSQTPSPRPSSDTASLSPSPTSSPASTTQPSPTAAPIKRGNGLSYDACASTADCRPGRECLDLSSSVGGYKCCDKKDNSTCACMPDKLAFCKEDDDCEQGEKCASTRADVPRCMSARAQEEFEADDFFKGGACIDAEMLEHLEDKELVFAEHKRKKVLCDLKGSCATPGHVVIWNGKVVMMRTYCRDVQCVWKAMLVNSPKYRIGLSVPSRTEGLAFTAFAARFETMAEERFFSAAVRIGF